ncbi:hypothetical protein RhiirA1_457209 [Rhizophagus irregularis]|uniref:Ion transport domain-containing protein n=2 Tax=Rhizophagus irregularis TaxID=588596 RepID=A0A2N0RM51_9GLOM|nr:hypothetical protein RhiirA1_464591 [Rhizophagus irregularis]PKC64390.1 hypothetical protein RhiirA1_462500 [Rhizophagus irregularis]PKC68453.1 hypothetical protein RhiirA1_457209 [Rhizophagus irregularis]
MTRDMERGNQTYGEKISYVAISPDGSIVATFNPYGSSILITKVATSKVATSENAEIRFNRKKFFDMKPSNILGWSLTVSDIIDSENNIGLIAISCITDEDMNPKLKTRHKKLNRRAVKLLVYSISINLFLILNFLFIPYPLFILFLCISLYYCFYNLRYIVNNIKPLTWNSSKGIMKLFKFSFENSNNNSTNMNNVSDTSIYKYCLGGVVSFLKNSKNSSNCATLVCTNCIKIQKIGIKLNELNELTVHDEDDYILPENLYKELESFEDSRCNWKYLLKSRFREFLMVDTSDYQQIQSIEIYDINTSQLVNVFYRRRREKDFIISRNNEPGIFAISTDSRLFAYSCGDNIITTYLMESGLEVVSKKFNNICKIKFLEFIEKDKKLFIIEADKEHNVKFHIWIISGCLNDYFSISREDIGLSDSNISILSKYDEHQNTFTKANGKVIFYNKADEKQFSIVHEVSIKRAAFGENDPATDEHEYQSCDLEPWNNNATTIRGKFLYNDRRFLLLIGQNSIQLWKSKSIKFMDFNNFKFFENSNLVYILISDKIKPEIKTKFLIEDDMTTVIIHACKSLVYLYNRKHVSSIEKHQMFVSGITNIIKDFIRKYPDNWKLIEIQYPLIAYLIYSRSFSLIKYILFENAEKLHRPQSKYVSYPYYSDLKLYEDFKLNNEDLKLNDEDLKSVNDLELALEFRKDKDTVILAYLLEYYTENSMTHIGWMINVTKILPKLPANYAELLYYKPCFGGINYNFPNKRFKELSVSEDNLKVYMPLTRLKTTESLTFSEYKQIGDEELHNIYMVPLPNFTTYNTNITKKFRGKLGTIFYWLRKTLFPPGYKNLSDKDLSPFLQINKKNKGAFFNAPVMEAVITLRWKQTKYYWMISLLFYSTFLILFAFSVINDDDLIETENDFFIILDRIYMGIFYYAGIYLLIIEFMQMKKYKTEYFKIFNIFDLCSIMLGIIVFTLISIKSFDETNGVDGEGIVVLMTLTTLILWIEMLLRLRLFARIAIYIYIFGNILRSIIPFFAFMLILIVAFGHSMFVLFAHPSFLNLIPSAPNFTLNDGTTNFTLTGESPDNPFDTIWDAILSAYYWDTIDLSPYHYWPLKLFAFIANVILVLVLLNMVIALMNDTFNKAKEDGKLGLLVYRTELINDYERLDDLFFSESLYNSQYICFHRDPNLMKKWMIKSQELKEVKLYSWYNDEDVSKEEITFDNGVDINLWYAFITGNESLNSASGSSTPDHLTLWF